MVSKLEASLLTFLVLGFGFFPFRGTLPFRYLFIDLVEFLGQGLQVVSDVPAVVRQRDFLYPAFLVEFNQAHALQDVQDLYGVRIRAVRFPGEYSRVYAFLASFQGYQYLRGLLPQQQILQYAWLFFIPHAIAFVSFNSFPYFLLNYRFPVF